MTKASTIKAKPRRFKEETGTQSKVSTPAKRSSRRRIVNDD